ncbi:MAG TPA: alpha-2-macroglobulin [Azospirillum sp.]|nr:alpha-2-macroglobulin [Azospirillum sp.]
MQRALARVFAVLVAWSVPALAAEGPAGSQTPPAQGAPTQPVAASEPVGFAVTGTEVLAERDVPQVCFTFTQPLEKAPIIAYRAFVDVQPRVEGNVVARDKTLCVEGLQHGQMYDVTLRAGLPSAAESQLAATEQRLVEVPNRKPSLAFRGAGYILPRVGPEGLPLRTVNVERARLQVLRLTDRAVVEQFYFGRINQQLTDYDVGVMLEKAAQEVWKGEMAVQSVRNAPVVTAFPIDAVLGKLEPGVYIAVASADGARADDWASKATQWFVISDLGLNTVMGEDGLLVFARTLSKAEPVGGVELRLLARNNAELGKATTGADGIARFPAETLHRPGDEVPQALFAERGADVGFLDLAVPGFDVSDRVPGGRTAPGPLDAFLYAERGIYRPGEAVNLAVLLRDEGVNAVAGKPLTLKVLRPDGFEADRRTLTDAGAGGYATRIDLPSSAFPGTWSVTAHAEPDGPAIGRIDLLVDDFVPPRLEYAVTASAKHLVPDDAAKLSIDAHYLFGAPAADLPGELSLTLRAARNPYPDHPGYRFGLAQEEVQPVRTDLPGFTTADSGKAETELKLDRKPESSKPLEAVLRATIFDIGGRPVSRELVLPVRHQPFAIGVKPRFEGDGVPEGATAGFDVIAVGSDGAPVDKADLSYELYEEDYEYVWYEASGRWDYKVQVKDKRVTGGTLAATAAKPVSVEEPVGAGRYRLEVVDRASGVATSVRFAAGWWMTPTAADRPDKVEVTAMLPSYKGGDTAWVYVKPPYKSQVLLAVADRKVRQALTREIGPEGAFLQIPVDGAWTGGVYVVATAFAMPDPQLRGAPRRAIGSAWLAVDPAARMLGVEVAAPAEAEPRRTVTAEVTVKGAQAGKPAFVTLAAVDDSVLQLTDFWAPDPNDYYLGKRHLGVELRDVYGRLIGPEAERAATRVPEPRRTRQVTALPQKTDRVVSLFSGILPVGEGGKVSVPLELPDFQGRLRLMAVAWSGDKLGHSDTSMLVRDKVVADLALPRFLAPDDKAQVLATLDNLNGAAGAYTIKLSAAGSVTLENGEVPVPNLTRGKRASVGRVLTAGAAGPGSVTLEVTGANGYAYSRTWKVMVRPASAPVVRKQVAQLPPGQTVAVPADLAAGLRSETMVTALSLGTLPDFDAPGLLLTLERHPYGSAEQAASRVLPLLSVGDLAISLGIADAERIKVRVQRSLDRMLTMQRADGAFALWSPKGDADQWLTPYVMDVLGRAKAAGYRVPEVPYRKGMEWLRQFIDNTWFDIDELPGRAYAHYVLARAKAVDASATQYFQETYWDKLQTDFARAQVAAALAHLGDTKRATEAFDKLAGGARVVPPSLRDYGSVVRDQAGVVALMAESGVDREKIVAAADRLTKAYATMDVPSAQEQAWLLLASKALADRSTPMKVSVGEQTIEGAKMLHQRIDPAAAPVVKNLGGEALRQAITVVGVPSTPPAAEGQGLKIARRVFDMEGRPVDAARVAQNELLVVILEGESTDPLDHQVLVVDPLPAGLEIENVRLASSGQLGSLTWLGELSPARHVDYREDRFVAAVDLTKEKPGFRLVYLVRAMNPGDYLAPGVSVEDMNRPHLFARSAPARLRVQREAN